VKATLWGAHPAKEREPAASINSAHDFNTSIAGGRLPMRTSGG
jgi:hypothetical protein